MSSSSITEERPGVRTDRLGVALEAVKLAPPDRFDMRTWIRHGGECGTAACVCGWYAISTAPLFGWCLDGAVIKSDFGVPMRFAGWAEHFGIGASDAGYLFDATCYDPKYDPNDNDFETDHKPTKEQVIERLTAFIEKHEAAVAAT